MAKEIISQNVKKNLNASERICFIYQGGPSYLDIDAFSYLRKEYPKSVLIYKYNDLVSLNECLYPGFLDRCRKLFDLIITYNSEDAEKYGLIVTGGSDFHGSVKPQIELGVGKGNLKIPYSVLQNLLNVKS